jgi:adenylate kinase
MQNGEKIPIIAFIGAEGSGKSTQAKNLAIRLNLPYVSTGNMLRDAAENDTTELGDACRKMFEQHNYLPAEKLLEVVGKRLKKDDIDKGVVLDGGFRTLEETVNFPEMLLRTGKDFSVRVFFLKVPYWKCAERLMGENGRKRADDTPEAWLSRMKEFNTDLQKRVSIIRTRWSLDTINGSGIEEEVKNNIWKKMQIRK